HASAPTAPMEPSPYLPVTRRYSNPIYTRVEEIQEFAYLPAGDRERIDGMSAPLHAADLTADLLDRDATWAAKCAALELVFAVPRTPGRQAEYQDYLTSEGRGLDGFATWCALAEQYGHSWNEWPMPLQDPTSPEVADEVSRLAERIEFHRWMQWVLDIQMAGAQTAARAAGMGVGVIHDIAVGVHRYGSDTWTSRDVMAREVTVGAPPDSFNQMGQDWSQPPRRPDQLAATGYESYRDMLRTLLRHSGGLRIDHVLGLFRLWWIPEGMPPSMGTYVKYDHHAMVDILVLEAHRQGALVVGEDLGTVEPWVRDFLAERGILGTTILWFEASDPEGRVPLPPQKWRARAMASVTVHDLPPTRGYIAGDHVRLRDELNLLTRTATEEAAAHDEVVQAWRKLLVDMGMLREGAGTEELVVALHRALTASPSRLISVALPDLVGDRRTQNQPGTQDEYPNWRIPLCDSDGKPILLEELPDCDLINTVISAVGGSTRSQSPR
ncbi:MAG: 4-alpha-glucanotransferase, partial [Actinomycetes bacterium]